MTKAQHTPTPGPWTQGSNYEVVAMDGTNICKVHDDEGQGAANARFLSKAPAMLDALRALLEDEGLILDCLNQMEGRGAEDRNAKRFDTVRAILSRIGIAE
jgi:hypothetical protein